MASDISTRIDTPALAGASDGRRSELVQCPRRKSLSADRKSRQLLSDYVQQSSMLFSCFSICLFFKIFLYMFFFFVVKLFPTSMGGHERVRACVCDSQRARWVPLGGVLRFRLLYFFFQKKKLFFYFNFFLITCERLRESVRAEGCSFLFRDTRTLRSSTEPDLFYLSLCILSLALSSLYKVSSTSIYISLQKTHTHTHSLFLSLEMTGRGFTAFLLTRAWTIDAKKPRSS